MDFKNSEIAAQASHQFQVICDRFTDENGAQILVAHFGEFSQDLVNSLSEGMESMLFDKGASKRIIKRMFSILIEGLQNVRIHGQRDNKNLQLGHVVVAENNDEFFISFGNYIQQSKTDDIINRVEKLNKQTLAEVKEKYLEVLSNGLISDKGGAGLGFITIALKSESKLNYSINELTGDINYFEYNVNLKKS